MYWVPTAGRHSARPQGYKMSKKDSALQQLRQWQQRPSHKFTDARAWAQVLIPTILAFNSTLQPPLLLPQPICSTPLAAARWSISNTTPAPTELFARNHLSSSFSLSNSATDPGSSFPWNIPQCLHLIPPSGTTACLLPHLLLSLEWELLRAGVSCLFILSPVHSTPHWGTH